MPESSLQQAMNRITGSKPVQDIVKVANSAELYNPFSKQEAALDEMRKQTSALASSLGISLPDTSGTPTASNPTPTPPTSPTVPNYQTWNDVVAKQPSWLANTNNVAKSWNVRWGEADPSQFKNMRDQYAKEMGQWRDSANQFIRQQRPNTWAARPNVSGGNWGYR